MGIYSTRAAIGLGRPDRQDLGKMPEQVYEEVGFGSEPILKKPWERLQELAAINRALEEELVANRKREAELRENLVNYKLLAEVTPAFIHIIRGEKPRLIALCPEGFAGYTAEEIYSASIWKIVHPDFQEIVREQYEAHRRGEVSTSIFSIKIISKTGQERWMEIETRAISHEGEPAVLVAPRDISRYKWVEEELIALLRQKECEIQAQASQSQAQRMEVVGQLAGGMAHELNNQLTVICACVDLNLSRLSKSDRLYHELLRIRNSAQVSANLTRQLLLFSRRHPLFKTPTDLNRRVEQLMEMLTRLMGEKITIRLEANPYLWMVNVDAANIDQVIVNLMRNAGEAMPGGGTVTIKTENVYRGAGQTDANPGRFVCLSVSDAGTGIDEANTPHIFEPFFTTKGLGKGTGLGLSVAYGIVQAHGGWIEVDSTPGQGSTFRFYLPALLPEVWPQTEL